MAYQNVTLQAKGLYSFPNQLSQVPDGALTTASNVSIDRDGVINPRRGFKLYGDTVSASMKQLLLYKSYILRHWSTKLDIDTDGAGTFANLQDLTGSSASVTEVSTGSRIKYVEASGNLYFTTDNGICKLSLGPSDSASSQPITYAGGIKALDASAELNATEGWFTQDSVVAYRVLWGIRDRNDNVIEGVPSEPVVISNSLLTLLIKDYNNLLQDLTTVASVAPLVLTGDTTNTSTTVNNVTTTNLSIGMTVTGAGIPANTTISSVGTTSIVISNAATATATGVSLTFGQKLDNTAYSSLQISVNSSASTLYTSLKTLANGVSNLLDTDMGGTTFQSITLTPSSTPDNPPTTQSLEEMQSYFDAIVNALNTTHDIASYALSSIGGAFTNSTQSATVDLTATIPSNVTTSHFYQVYRSALFTSTGTSTLSDMTPDDELRLVYEDNPTSSDISNGYVTFNDNVPVTLRDNGANLYTNANSGEGIAQANERPPLAHDIAYFKGSTFYANTKTAYKAQINLLTAVGLNGSTFQVKRGGTTNTYTFVNSVSQVVNITCVAGNLYTAAGTADYFDIYSANNANHYRVWFSVGTAVAPSAGGATLVQCTIANTDTNAQVAAKLQVVLINLAAFQASVASNVVTVTNEDTGPATAPTENVANAGFTVAVATTGSGEDAANKKIGISNAPTPAQAIDETARSLIHVLNKNSAEIVTAYYLSGTQDLPGQLLLEAKNIGDTAFTVIGPSGKFNPEIESPGYVALNEVNPNRVFFSKYQQPEAVPLLNYLDVGPKNKQILRILPLRDSLFILAESGVWRLSGDSTSTFQVSLFDSSARLRAPDSAQVLNNQIYMCSNQGVTSVSDTGVSVVSRPIENKLLGLLTSAYTNFDNNTFAVSYESDRSYLLFTVLNPSDTSATVCYRYNTFTNTWVSWDLEKTCGVVNTGTDLLYLGPVDVHSVEIERKTFTRLDHADREFQLDIPQGEVTGNTIKYGTVNNLEVGDVIIQTQYLTISQYNRLLTAMDTDRGLSFKGTYYSTYFASAGEKLRDKLTLLAAKLDTDTGIASPTFAATIAAYTDSFVDTQSAFNAIVTKLNADSGTYFKNYLHSTGTLPFEVPITDIDTRSLEITVAYDVPFIVGPSIIYKHIPSTVVWAPHHFGDASLMKSVAESTLIFENMSFTTATAGYGSDLSPGFDSVDIVGEGTGIFGSFVWGEDIVWGGAGSGRPFRTFVPASKQRCRYINGKFSHGIAFEKYALYGLSFTYSAISSRAYR